jgi:polyhydroxybutyrate depolymerase
MCIAQLCLIVSFLTADPLAPGDHRRTLMHDGLERSYRMHLPPQYDGAKPLPVVLNLHGAATNGDVQITFTGMNRKSDEAGFIVVYPEGTGPNAVALFWNSGGPPLRRPGKSLNDRDDVGFIRAVLDDLAGVAKIDAKRVYCTGMSNGGMMTHRLGIELADRLAAIAPVAGTIGIKDPKPARAVPVLHIHGTKDTFVPWEGWKSQIELFVTFNSVDEAIDFWVKHNGSRKPPKIEQLPDAVPDDGMTVERYTYAAGPQGAEVVLVKIIGGGHTWPGQSFRLEAWLGKVCEDFDANDLIWDFFQRHKLP